MQNPSQTTTLLKDLIAIPSAYPNEAKISEYVYEYLKNIEGVCVVMQEVEPGRCNVIATKGSGEKVHGFCGHLDTVRSVPGWSLDPHEGTVKDDRMYGLGAYDMKGGVAAMMRAFVESKPLHTKIILVLTIDEENVAAGCEHFLRSEVSKGVSHLVICEPAFSHGQQGIVIGRSGWGWINISLTQLPRHFNEYSPTRDLQLLWAKVIEFIHSLNRNDEMSGGKQFVYARETHAEGTGLSLCTRITAQCDCSILLPDSGVKLAEKIHAYLIEQIRLEFDPDIQCKVSFDPGARSYYAPYTMPTSSPYFKALTSAVVQTTNSEAIPYFRSSVSDENILAAAGINVLGIGPEGYGAHAPDEWVSISSVERLKNILAYYINKLDV